MDDWERLMSDQLKYHGPPPVLNYASPTSRPAGGRMRWFAVSAFASTFMILAGFVVLEDKDHLEALSQLLCAGIAIPAVVAAIGTAIVIWTMSVRNSLLG